MIHLGDLFDVLPTLDAESSDACVTDPPYGIGFMGKAWDNFAPAAAAARIVPNRAIDSDNPNVKGRTRGPASSPSAVEYNRSLEGQRDFQVWTERWAREVVRVLKPGSYLVVAVGAHTHSHTTDGRCHPKKNTTAPVRHWIHRHGRHGSSPGYHFAVMQSPAAASSASTP